MYKPRCGGVQFSTTSVPATLCTYPDQVACCVGRNHKSIHPAARAAAATQFANLPLSYSPHPPLSHQPHDPSIPDAAPPFPGSALLFPSSPNHSHHHGGSPACAKLTRLTSEPVRSFDQTKPDGTVVLLQYYDMIL